MIPLTKHRLLFDQDNDSPLGGLENKRSRIESLLVLLQGQSMNVNELKDDANEPFKVLLETG
jgi:hypothetical protein